MKVLVRGKLKRQRDAAKERDERERKMLVRGGLMEQRGAGTRRIEGAGKCHRWSW